MRNLGNQGGKYPTMFFNLRTNYFWLVSRRSTNKKNIIFFRMIILAVHRQKKGKPFTGRKMEPCEYIMPIVDFPPPPTELTKLRLCVLPRDIQPVLSKTLDNYIWRTFSYRISLISLALPKPCKKRNRF